MKTLEIQFDRTWNHTARRNAIQKGVVDIKGCKLIKIQLKKGSETIEWQGTQLQSHVLRSAESFIITYELSTKASGADFSNDGRYRYRLWRIWDDSKPLVLCIGLNPSTANGEKNDQTISYLIKMFTILGYGGFYMMNCWAYVSTDPKVIVYNEMTDEWNNNLMTTTASKCKDVVFAWGTFKIVIEKGRDKELEKMFPNAKCFGKNKDGTPFHPLAMMPRNGRDPNYPTLIEYKNK